MHYIWQQRWLVGMDAFVALLHIPYRCRRRASVRLSRSRTAWRRTRLFTTTAKVAVFSTFSWIILNAYVHDQRATNITRESWEILQLLSLVFAIFLAGDADMLHAWMKRMVFVTHLKCKRFLNIISTSLWAYI